MGMMNTRTRLLLIVQSIHIINVLKGGAVNKKIIIVILIIFTGFLLMNCGSGSDYRDLSTPGGSDGSSSDSSSDEIPDELIGNWLSDDVIDDMRLLMRFHSNGECEKMYFDATAEERLEIEYHDFSIDGNIITYGPHFYGEDIETDEFEINGDTLVLDGRTYHQVEESFFDGK